ncbi:MAG TPA: serine/threonine-protein kinase, partial [Leptospiraceae bacterium]|nr:serine/threonine-protein kinase [Leptospiraceae bacterium]
VYIADRSGSRYVLKYYNTGMKPKVEVLEKLKGLDHPDIVKLLEFGEHKGRFFEIMQYAAGGSLADRKSDGTLRYLPMNVETVKQVVAETVNALRFCHGKGIFHRDLKPANLFYLEEGNDILIGDFGISSIATDGRSRVMTSNLSKTEGYAAPELYSSIIGPELDYYALGITVWELLTGKEAFEGRNAAHVMRDTIEGRVAEDLVTRPEAKEFPDSIRKLIYGLLTVQHERRWGYEHVQRWLAGEDVAIHRERPATAVEPFQFTQDLQVRNLKEMVAACRGNREQAKKYFFRGYIERWVEKFDQPLSVQIGDLREEVGNDDSKKEKAFRRLLYMLQPGEAYICADGMKIGSIADLKNALEESPESVASHLKEPDGDFYEYLSVIGSGQVHQKLAKIGSSEKTMKRLVNRMLVVLNGGIIRPFENTKYKGTELSSLDQLNNLPAGLKARVDMELEDPNSLVACWRDEMKSAPAGNACSSCGQSLTGSPKFCPRCGKKVG